MQLLPSSLTTGDRPTNSSKQYQRGCCSTVSVVPTPSRGANWYYTEQWGGRMCEPSSTSMCTMGTYQGTLPLWELQPFMLSLRQATHPHPGLSPSSGLPVCVRRDTVTVVDKLLYIPLTTVVLVLVLVLVLSLHWTNCCRSHWQH